MPNANPKQSDKKKSDEFNYNTPFSFKNGKERVKTNSPKLNDEGHPIVKNGKVVMNYENKKDENGKAVYDYSVIFVTFVPKDGKLIPPSLNIKTPSGVTMLKAMKKHADSVEMGFDYLPNQSYSNILEFDPQEEIDTETGEAFTTITVKYSQKYQSKLAGKPMKAW